MKTLTLKQFIEANDKYVTLSSFVNDELRKHSGFCPSIDVVRSSCFYNICEYASCNKSRQVSLCKSLKSDYYLALDLLSRYDNDMYLHFKAYSVDFFYDLPF